MNFEVHALIGDEMVLVVGVKEGQAVIPDFPPFDPDSVDWLTPSPNCDQSAVPALEGKLQTPAG